jgi:hypothetical protein
VPNGGGATGCSVLGCDLPANDERADYVRATLAPGPDVAALSDQIEISNLHVVGIQHLRVLAIQALIQNPRDIAPVNNPKNESLFWREILGHGGDSDSSSPHRMQSVSPCNIDK